MILSFTGDYEFLSNFYPSRITMPDGIDYDTVEAAFQAHKTHDLEMRRAVAFQQTPRLAKRLGRSLQLRDDWEQIKIQVMAECLRKKFSIPELRTELLNTFPAELVEGNTWGDTYWGVCKGVGENHLGKLLMTLRANIYNSP